MSVIVRKKKKKGQQGNKEKMAPKRGGKNLGKKGVFLKSVFSGGGKGDALKLRVGGGESEKAWWN